MKDMASEDEGRRVVVVVVVVGVVVVVVVVVHVVVVVVVVLVSEGGVVAGAGRGPVGDGEDDAVVWVEVLVDRPDRSRGPRLGVGLLGGGAV